MSTTNFFDEPRAADTTVTVKFDNSEAGPRYAIGYWSIRGLGAPLSMMMCAAKINHTFLLYDQLEDGNGGWKNTYTADKQKCVDSHPFWNLPYVLDKEDGHVVTQSNACLSFLARKCNMFGSNEKMTSQCEQLLCEIYDIRNIMVGFAYSQSGNSQETKKAALNTVKRARGNFKKLERWLELQKKSDDISPHFLVGKTFSAPDFHLFEMLDQFDGLCSFFDIGDFLKDFPALRAFKKGFGALEENQFYLTSWLHQDLPYNNRMAQFGSIPGPGTYKYGDIKSMNINGKGMLTLSP